MNVKTKKFLKNLISRFRFPLVITWSLIFIFIIFRIFDLIIVNDNNFLVSLVNYGIGLKYDLVFALIIGLFSSAIFIFIPNNSYYILKKSIAYFIVVLTGMFSLFVTEYFWETQLPLNEIIFVYSYSDTLNIVKSSTTISIYFIIRTILTLCACVLIPYFLLKKKKFPLWLNLTALFSFIILVCISNNIVPNISQFEEESLYYKQMNKASFFLYRVYSKDIKYEEENLEDAIDIYHSLLNKNKYFSHRYPFMKNRNTANVLEPYFDLKDEMPNIVFIIVESLSSRFSGLCPKVASFTPFIDSLAENGLYWKNFLTTSGRTFNILPSTLASAPYGEKGFSFLPDTCENYPNILSISSILKKNGYDNRFFHGSDLGFEKTGYFMKYIDFTTIIGYGDYDTLRFPKMPEAYEGFSWGFSDEALFTMGSEISNSLNHRPFLDVFLTISTHEPFMLNDSDFWKKKVEERIKLLNPDKKTRDYFSENTAGLSTLLFMDNSLRNYFEEQKKQEHFENTIYIILGDHNMAISNYNILDKYGVPLVIYSPLLKETKLFPAVSSSADISPSILNLLDEKYDIGLTDKVPWLGDVLDTCSYYRSLSFIPLMRPCRTLEEMIWGDYMYSCDRIFKVEDMRSITKIDDKPKILAKYKSLLLAFKTINQYTYYEDMIYFEDGKQNLKVDNSQTIHD